jgi:hypothetical protein
MQEPEAQKQVEQARLAVLQSASRSRINKLLLDFDLDSLAECQRIASTAQLGQDVLDQVQKKQEAAAALQAAADKLQQQQQQQEQQDDGTENVAADLQLQLAVCLKKVEELCRPGASAAAVAWTSDQVDVLESTALWCWNRTITLSVWMQN